MQIIGASDVKARLSEYGIVPVIRMDSPELAYTAVKLLQGIGFRTAEMTMTVPGAIDIIHDLARETDLLIGAGTVSNAQEAEACIRAGARYIISPFIIDEIIEVCRDADILCIMSGLTPNEVLNAWNKGSAVVKVFPAHSMGGPSHLKSLKSILPQVPLVPTGGVNLNNLTDYFKVGAAFVGVGSELVNPTVIEQEEVFSDLGQEYLSIVKKYKTGG